MADKHGSYYVPEYSIWPIIGSIGFFFFALGSLNFSSVWGTFFFSIGGLILAGMLFGWLSNVVQESKKGLYDEQMNRTFLWGMFWFLFCETFFFGTPLGALIYVRMASLPWMAGTGSGGSLMTHYVLWPDFKDAWPLLKNPNYNAFPTIKKAPSFIVPLLNTFVIFASVLTGAWALQNLKKRRSNFALVGLLLTIGLGILFLVSQIRFMQMLGPMYGLTISSGIYGSLVFLLYGLHTLHVIAGLFILVIIFLLTLKKHFTSHRTFGFAAAVWLWSFIAIMWLLIFICVYWS